MGKGNSANPADAYRKAQRKKELKKNKSDRQKARDFALVKKDTSELEAEIEQLEGKPESSAIEQARLKELKADLEKINKKKDDYVAEHPEQRRLVFKAKRKQQEEEPTPVPAGPTTRSLFNKKGLPKHPERSIYYDAVMNPFGVPPPGMPYAERPLRPEEVDSDQEKEQDSDDDIAMPDEPPPGEAIENEDSDDDIPMPEGPPPGQQAVLPVSTLASPAYPPLPPPPNWPGPPGGLPMFMPQFPGVPPPPPRHSLPTSAGLPPLPAGFPTPPAPPGFFSRRNQALGAMQDPLSNIPHQTYQAYQANRSELPIPPPPPPLSQPPSASPSGTSGLVAANATVFAAPELRDLKKESTAFLPTSLKRKKAAGGTKLNAAPSVGASAEDSPAGAVRPDLVSALKDQFGAVPAESKKGETSKSGTAVQKTRDDYAKFVEELGDILNA